MDMTEVPILDTSPALQEMKRLFDKIKSDEIVVAGERWGHVGAKTRLRVALAKMAKLCKQSRKEIPSN